MVIAVTATLGLARDIGPAVTATRRHHPFGLVRCLRQRAMLAFARWTLPTPGLAALAPTLAEIVLRGRNMRILRGLARFADQCFQFRNPRRQTLDHLVLRYQQLVLLGVTQDMKRGQGHPKLESASNPPRKPFLSAP